MIRLATKLPRLCSLLLFACFCVSLPELAAEEKQVELKKNDTSLSVHIGGQPFGTYNFGQDLPKPFFLPVHAPNGIVMTRGLNDQRDKDHPHHKGIWVSVDEVNGVKYWNEDGRIRNHDVTVDTAAGSAAKFTVTNHWLSADGNPVVEEKTQITVHGNYLLAYDIQFKAVADHVSFGDTKEGLFGFRMAPTMKEKETGTVVNADGKQGTKACWGQQSAWVDYFGTIEGKVCGLAIFDHPGNFRPSRYHVRNYGLFSINPFGERAYTGRKNPAQPVQIKKGESFRLRYAMYLHAGSTTDANVAAVYKRYVKSTP